MRVFAVYHDIDYHICGLNAELCIINAVAEESSVEGEGISACVVRNLCVCENLIYGEFGLHYGVVGGSEHCLNAVGNKCLCGEGDFVNGGAGALDNFNALGLEIRLRVGYRLSRRI